MASQFQPDDVVAGNRRLDIGTLTSRGADQNREGYTSGYSGSTYHHPSEAESCEVEYSALYSGVFCYPVV